MAASTLDLLLALWMLLSHWLWRHGLDPAHTWVDQEFVAARHLLAPDQTLFLLL